MRFQRGEAVHSPTHILTLKLQIIILVSTEVFEYLFMIRVVGIFFKPTYQSIPTIRNVSVPVIAAGTDDIFEFKAFVSGKLSQFWFRVCSCLFLGILRMYLIAKPVSFTDAEASILMHGPLHRLDCLLEASKNKSCPNTCRGIESPLFEHVVSPGGAYDFDLARQPSLDQLIPGTVAEIPRYIYANTSDTEFLSPESERFGTTTTEVDYSTTFFQLEPFAELDDFFRSRRVEYLHIAV